MGVLSPDKLDFLTTGNPEVVIQGMAGALFFPLDPNAFDRIKDDQLKLGAMIVFSVLYPPRLVFVRSASGKWKVAY